MTTKTPVPLRAWLFSTVLPFWADAGLDRTGGGFVEALDRSFAPAGEVKRIRVQARQVYTFSHAAVLGAGPWALDAARAGVSFLVDRGWDGENGGWFATFARDGTPLDRRKDTYDAAFLLLALAWYHRATGEQAVLDWVGRTIGFLDSELLDLAQGGYREHLEADGRVAAGVPRRQNPHMHLLEAFLALHAATGAPSWLDRIGSILDLLLNRFVDAGTGTLVEYFTDDWRPAQGAAGQVREPGHHFEWVWLLGECGRLIDDRRLARVADRFWRHGMAHGIDRQPGMAPAAFDETDPAGAVTRPTKRLWPQTEAVKAALARADRFGDPAGREAARAHLAMMFDVYLDRDGAVWRDQVDCEGREISRLIPASTLYHLFVCMAEALRVLGPDETV